MVTVEAPRESESFYVTQSVTIEWLATDDGALRCEVIANDGATTITIASDLAPPSGEPQTQIWMLAGVTPSATYRVRVTCLDDSAPPLVGIDESGTFAVTAPPQPVSFATQVRPILEGSCTSAQCHDGVMPQQGLDLTAARALVETVGVASQQCPSTQLVRAGAPSDSYLVMKLQGSGSCFQGTKMPKPPQTLSTAQIQLVRDWIANGAPNN